MEFYIDALGVGNTVFLFDSMSARWRHLHILCLKTSFLHKL